MSGAELLNCSEIATALGRNRSYISAMKRAGYQMEYGTKDTLKNALQWLSANPTFRTALVYPKRPGNRPSLKPSRAGKSGGSPNLHAR